MSELIGILLNKEKESNHNSIFVYAEILLLCVMIAFLITPLWARYEIFTHTALELLCIFIALSIFAVVWSNYKINSMNSRIIGFGFLIIATFDLFHAFYYQTSAFEYLWSRELSLNFWALDRLAEVMLLLTVSLRLKFSTVSKTRGFTIALSIIIISSFLVFMFPSKPKLWTGESITNLEIFLKYGIIFIATFFVLKTHTNMNKEHYRYLFMVILLLITVEINFTLYTKTLSSFYMVMGHILRSACYIFVLKGAFIKTTEYSYKKIENALNLSENLFETAFENAPIGMALLTIDGMLIKANTSLCDITGYPEKTLLKMSYKEIVHIEDIAIYSECKNKLVDDTFLSFSCERRCYTASGTLIWTRINMSLVKDASENPLYFIAQVEDITERKKAAELKITAAENEIRLKETLELEQLRTDFFANLSHEFRTPLNVILSALQLIELYFNKNDELKIEKISNTMKLIKQNCLRLLRLINNLIDMTKIDAGFFQISLENHNIISIVEEITLSVAEYVQNKGINLIFDTDVEEKFMACDPDKIERIILNIISNSLKFTDKKGLITVNMYDKGDCVQISIKDTGLGIPEDKLNLIFERFRQVDKSTTRNKEGSGIGLSIVKSFIEMHGGTIEVKSKYGEGSEFIISLPAKKVTDTENEPTSMTNIQPLDHIEKINVEFSDIYF